MTPKRLREFADLAEDFNRRAAALKRAGDELIRQRADLVATTRAFGFLKDDAEEMYAEVRCEVNLPEPEAEGTDDQPQDAAQQDDAPAADGDAEQGRAA